MVDLSRIECLVGKEKTKLLSKKHVLICGVGGVGSFVAEALARSGIGTLTIIDSDTIESSNINRQLMATKNNIGEDKVKELKKRLEEISDCSIIEKRIKIDEKFEIENKYDYVVDCIDMLSAKYHLIKSCHQKNIPILSSLGTAKRTKVENIKLSTLDKTKNDPLAKALRQFAKKENYKRKIEVVFVDSAPIKTKNNELGSSIFVVGSVGLYIASVVFERLIKQ